MSSENTKEENRLKNKLERIEKELDKCRAKEYELPFGSSRRAKASLAWDYWAKEKMKIVNKLNEL